MILERMKKFFGATGFLGFVAILIYVFVIGIRR